ncbi:hypothetical protein JCM30237_28680 [Halolamina litorea]
MKLMLGLLRPDSGTARLFGEPAHEFDERSRLGYVAQHAGASKEIPITVRKVVGLCVGIIASLIGTFLVHRQLALIGRARTRRSRASPSVCS